MSQPVDVPQVDAEDAARRIAAGAIVLDVREPDEWEAGHVAYAVHIPLGSLASSHEQLEREAEIVVVCRSGGRSQQAAEFLRAQGFPASNLAGGMRAWAAAGLDVVAAAGGTGSVI